MQSANEYIPDVDVLLAIKQSGSWSTGVSDPFEICSVLDILCHFVSNFEV